MNEYPGTSLRTRILGRHYDLVSGRHYDLVSWGAIMTEYPGTPL